MLKKLKQSTYIYSFKYDYHHNDLSRLESRQLFNEEQENKLLFSTIKVDPSISFFIKSRFKIIFSANNYSELLKNLEKENISINGFKAEYLILKNDSTEKIERVKKLKDVGYRINGEPNFDAPSIIYSICHYKDVWYFGELVKNNVDWRNHKNKPCSFSNSLSIDIAKTLVSVASKGVKTNRLLDACCGVGTVLLEACFAGFNIEGCDINWKACKHSRENLAHYNYTANVYRSDIKDISEKYDAAIIDLPYNLYSYSNDDITSNIIESTTKLTDRIIIVSISDIKDIIEKFGLKISDFCPVEKRGKSKFTRSIWVCEKK